MDSSKSEVINWIELRAFWEQHAVTFTRVPQDSAIRRWADAMLKKGRPWVAVFGVLNVGPPVEDLIWRITVSVRVNHPCLRSYVQGISIPWQRRSGYGSAASCF